MAGQAMYREIKDPHKLFEAQVARNDGYSTDGVNGCHAWLKRVRNYLVGRESDLVTLLPWAER